MACLALKQMELDQKYLQFLFTVIAITVITTLAAICHLLRRDNRELLRKLNPQAEPDKYDIKNRSASPIQAVSAPETDALSQNEPEAQPGMEKDIREYVTHRRPRPSRPVRTAQ